MVHGLTSTRAVSCRLMTDDSVFAPAELRTLLQTQVAMRVFWSSATVDYGSHTQDVLVGKIKVLQADLGSKSTAICSALMSFIFLCLIALSEVTHFSTLLREDRLSRQDLDRIQILHAKYDKRRTASLP